MASSSSQPSPIAPPSSSSMVSDVPVSTAKVVSSLATLQHAHHYVPIKLTYHNYLF